MTSVESDSSYSPSSSQSDDIAAISVEKRVVSGSVRARHYREAPGTFTRRATLTPSQDPDINNLFIVGISEADGQRVFTCRKCSKDYTRPYNARRHSVVHLNRINCAVCTEKLNGPLSMKEHMRECHPAAPSTTLSASRQPCFNRVKRSVIPAASVDDIADVENTVLTGGASPIESSCESLKMPELERIEMKEEESIKCERDQKPAILQPERRSSTRIQMRLALEASALEQQQQQLCKATLPKTKPGPFTHNTPRKARECRVHSDASAAAPPSEMPQIVYESVASKKNRDGKMQTTSSTLPGNNQQTTVETVSLQLYASEEGIAPSIEQSIDVDGEKSMSSVPTAENASLKDRSPQAPLSPCSSTASCASSSVVILSPQSIKTERASAVTGKDAGSSASSPPVVESALRCIGDCCDSKSSRSCHLGLGNLADVIVHQRQMLERVAAERLYPAPLTSGLLSSTVNHPAWARSHCLGLDEIRAIEAHGHAHLVLPVRMHRTETMIGRCMKALEETLMPLPPQLPLLPSPCSIFGRIECEPLSCVLERLPDLLKTKDARVSATIDRAPVAKDTMAFEGARQDVPMKSEERKWWEVRTFPSFSGLLSEATQRYLAKAAIPNGGPVYSVAHARQQQPGGRMKFTYVTPKCPIFSINESTASVFAQRCSSAPTLRDGMECCSPLKRVTTEPVGIDAQMKRIKPSYDEPSYSTRPQSGAVRPPRLVQQGVCVAAVSMSTSNGVQRNEDNPINPRITIDQDGTTFTVL